MLATVQVLFGHIIFRKKRFDKLEPVIFGKMANGDGVVTIVCLVCHVRLWPATVGYFGTEFIITVSTVHNKLIPFDS